MMEFAGIAMIVYLIGFFLWVYAFIKTLISEFYNNTNKIIWIIVLLFLPPTALLFPFIGINQIKPKIK